MSCLSGSLAVLSDVVVIVVTWHKARNFGKPIRSNYPSVITLMLCDGMSIIFPFGFPLIYSSAPFCRYTLFHVSKQVTFLTLNDSMYHHDRTMLLINIVVAVVSLVWTTEDKVSPSGSSLCMLIT